MSRAEAVKLLNEIKNYTAGGLEREGVIDSCRAIALAILSVEKAISETNKKLETVSHDLNGIDDTLVRMLQP